MPKLGCLCGEPIELIKTPNRNTFLILSEVLADDVVEKLIEAHKTSANVSEFSKQAFSAFTFKTPGLIQGIECQNCGRVAVFSQPVANPDFWLKRENGNLSQSGTLQSIFESAQNPSDGKKPSAGTA
jgi:hypothetical protein